MGKGLYFVAFFRLKPQDFERLKNMKKTAKNLEKSVDKWGFKCYINQALRCCGHFKPTTKIK